MMEASRRSHAIGRSRNVAVTQEDCKNMSTGFPIVKKNMIETHTHFAVSYTGH